MEFQKFIFPENYKVLRIRDLVIQISGLCKYRDYSELFYKLDYRF
jgi:hypothetical protein